MSSETKQLVRALLDLCALLVMLWFAMPSRPPLAPLGWRTAARATQSISDYTGDFSLWCRSNYWRAIRS